MAFNMNVISGLDLTDSAIGELAEARKELLSIKLHIVVDVCFMCKLCVNQHIVERNDNGCWHKLADVKDHLLKQHNLGKCSEKIPNKLHSTQDVSMLRETTTVGYPHEAGLTESSPIDHQETEGVRFGALPFYSSTMVDDFSEGEDLIENVSLPPQQSSGVLQQQIDSVQPPASDKLDEEGLCVAVYVSDYDTSPINKPVKKKWKMKNKCQMKKKITKTLNDESSKKISKIYRKSRKMKPCEQINRINTGVSSVLRARTCPQCELVLEDLESCWQHYTNSHIVAVKINNLMPVITELFISGKGIVTCPLCGKESRATCLLKHIILVHLWRPKLKRIRRKRDMLCPECGKAFHYEQNYYLHLRSVHRGIKVKSNSKYVAKQYTCDECAYTTCETRRLASHMKYAHSGIKTYSCKYCSYATWERTSLRDHMFRHAEDKPYHCDNCTYQCIQKKQLRAHLLNKHGIDLPKTGHTRVVARTGPMPSTPSTIEKTDREASTDPPLKRCKTKTTKPRKSRKKLDVRKVEQSFKSKIHSVDTPNDHSYGPAVKAQWDAPHQQQNQVLQYSVQPPIIAQVTPPKGMLSRISSNEPVVCSFTLASPVLSEQQLVLPSGEQVHSMMLPSRGQFITPEKAHVVFSQSPQTISESPATVYNLSTQNKIAYQVIQLQQGVNQLANLPAGQMIDNTGRLTETIAVTPIYAQNPQAGNNLALSGIGQINQEALNSQKSFVYVAR